MNKNKIIFISFLCVGIIQLSVVLYKVIRYEIILKTGEQYKVRTMPIDPHDVFRGKYLALGYQNTFAPIKKGDEIKQGSQAYVSLSKDKDGFAIYTELSAKPPRDKDYLRVKISHGNNFSIPFNRFYIEESVSKTAEKLFLKYFQQRNRNDTNNYAILRVKGGRGVIEDLYVNGIPIKRLVEIEGEKKEE